jgi:uncharacterized protein YdeI (YjbR/CyaY-like superfamily)
MARLTCGAPSSILATDKRQLYDYTPPLLTMNGPAHATYLQTHVFLSLSQSSGQAATIRIASLSATSQPHISPDQHYAAFGNTVRIPRTSVPYVQGFRNLPRARTYYCARLYVKLAKKNSGIPSITAAEAVEVALCYGWIDGRANTCDDAWWTVRYTPRRAKSIWSQKNVRTVARLIEAGRMRPAGLAAVDAAKADGRWDRAYAGSATMIVPEDFKNALARVPAAEAHWESLNKSDRYTTLLKVETGTRSGRSKRIENVIQMLATGRRAGSSSSKRPARKVAKRTEQTNANSQPDVQHSSSALRAGLRRRKS